MVSGDTIVEKSYFDEDTGNMIKVSLTIRDHIFFRLLSRIEAALKRW